jgi:predicted O-methyltransferase YrrM
MFQVNGVKFPKKVKPLRGYELYTEDLFQPTDAIRKIFKSGKVKTEDGKIKRLTDAVDPYEGYFLYLVIKENKFKNILEIGMANGMSALYICSALNESKESKDESSESNESYRLTSIDPFQKVQWENTGLQTLRDAGLLEYHTLIEELDYLALPKLLKQVNEGKPEGQNFDLILIDGNHLFDYTVLDFFFAVKLLNVGGMIVLDDIKHENTGKAYKYIKTNYQNLVELKNAMNSETQGSFIKIADDNRPWFYHMNF